MIAGVVHAVTWRSHRRPNRRYSPDKIAANVLVGSQIDPCRRQIAAQRAMAIPTRLYFPGEDRHLCSRRHLQAGGPARCGAGREPVAVLCHRGYKYLEELDRSSLTSRINDALALVGDDEDSAVAVAEL